MSDNKPDPLIACKGEKNHVWRRIEEAIRTSRAKQDHIGRALGWDDQPAVSDLIHGKRANIKLSELTIIATETGFTAEQLQGDIKLDELLKSASESRDDWEWEEAHRYVKVMEDEPFPSPFAKELAKAIPIQSDKSQFLDLGCGCGIVGIYCLRAKGAALVTFNDLRPEAISVTQQNVDRQINIGMVRPNRASCLPACDFRTIPYDVISKHDLLGFNAPQLPVSFTDPEYVTWLESHPLALLYRVGGKPTSNLDGLTKVREFSEWYAGLRARKPRAYLTLSSLLGRSRIEEIFHAFRLRQALVSQARVGLRSVLCEQASELYKNEAERADRSLKIVKGRWTKELFTYELS